MILLFTLAAQVCLQCSPPSRERRSPTNWCIFSREGPWILPIFLSRSLKSMGSQLLRFVGFGERCRFTTAKCSIPVIETHPRAPGDPPNSKPTQSHFSKGTWNFGARKKKMGEHQARPYIKYTCVATGQEGMTTRD